MHSAEKARWFWSNANAIYNSTVHKTLSKWQQHTTAPSGNEKLPSHFQLCFMHVRVSEAADENKLGVCAARLPDDTNI
jgi:hypothetical protein